ncbi:hypothetical protein GCM10025864_27980 [Luteimicrobium album]|uniref:Uncharacterized protein n=1 Tax=Luteimicrobium album TaxID=1054550 RepID=A0ABQ6I5E3_9MICO|nr:hypothetical protein GCM10025864_27980 [Luteimicrobium album]
MRGEPGTDRHVSRIVPAGLVHDEPREPSRFVASRDDDVHRLAMPAAKPVQLERRPARERHRDGLRPEHRGPVPRLTDQRSAVQDEDLRRDEPPAPGRHLIVDVASRDAEGRELTAGAHAVLTGRELAQPGDDVEDVGPTGHGSQGWWVGRSLGGGVSWPVDDHPQRSLVRSLRPVGRLACAPVAATTGTRPHPDPR